MKINLPKIREKLQSFWGFLTLSILVMGLAASVILVTERQEIRKKAVGKPVSDIALAVYCPNHLAISLGGSCPFSALAQDADGRFIWQGVTYEWGISSQNSIGTLSSISGPVTTITAKNEGYGDLWVSTYQEDGTRKYKSIGVNVGSTLPTPTPTPSATPTPTPPSEGCWQDGDLNCDGEVDLLDFEIFREIYIENL